MLTRLYSQREAVHALLGLEGDAPDRGEWATLGSLAELLKPVCELVRFVSTDDGHPLSALPLAVCVLIVALKELLG